jgi:hypothetical protein
MRKRNCPECKTALRPIKILDATHSVTGSAPTGHFELAYAAPDAERSFFMKKIEQQGTLRGMLCPDCGRALLYAVRRVRE